MRHFDNISVFAPQNGTLTNFNFKFNWDSINHNSVFMTHNWEFISHKVKKVRIVR